MIHSLRVITGNKERHCTLAMHSEIIPNLYLGNAAAAIAPGEEKGCALFLFHINCVAPYWAGFQPFAVNYGAEALPWCIVWKARCDPPPSSQRT